MTDAEQIMEITARTVQIARGMAVNEEQSRIKAGIEDYARNKPLSPEARLIIHEIRKILNGAEA